MANLLPPFFFGRWPRIAAGGEFPIPTRISEKGEYQQAVPTRQFRAPTMGLRRVSDFFSG
jgi:hypothetical protein